MAAVDPSLTTIVEQQSIALSQELAHAEQAMHTALAVLQPPFNQFVDGQLRQMLPLTRAAVVLTGGLPAVDSSEHRRRRIDLAAAQETLYLALRIHMRLLGHNTATDEQSRSILGSTILAGDFCFSRSAELAVRTGSPAVVEIFAETLKHVSEGHLRLLFAPGSAPYDETETLFDSGAHAAGVLAGLAAPALEAVRAQARGIAAHSMTASAAMGLDKTLTRMLEPVQTARWLALLSWLSSHRI